MYVDPCLAELEERKGNSLNLEIKGSGRIEGDLLLRCIKLPLKGESSPGEAGAGLNEMGLGEHGRSFDPLKDLVVSCNDRSWRGAVQKEAEIQ